MGKGLMAKKTGVHVAFAGGTGTLVFLDLVSRLILTNLGLLPDHQKLDDDFIFHFYASFRSESSYIGVYLCNKLVEVNKKLGKDNFKFHLRTSDQGSPTRWD